MKKGSVPERLAQAFRIISPPIPAGSHMLIARTGDFEYFIIAFPKRHYALIPE